MTVVYFGARWDAPMLDDPDDGSPGPVQVVTPVGASCYVCRQEIQDGERGLLRAGVVGDPPRAEALAVHAECDMLGVIGHQFGVCTCSGHDTTSRQAALALLAKVNEQRAASGLGPM